MPNNIELAISEALLMSSAPSSVSSPTTAHPIPDIAYVLSAYIKVSGFAELNPYFTVPNPNRISSAAISDVGLISAFERALEKASTASKAPGASEASKLVDKVRRQYWRAVLIAAGNKDDELTQLLIKAQHEELGYGVVLPICDSPPNPAPVADSDAPVEPAAVPSKKSKKKKAKKECSIGTIVATTPDSTSALAQQTTTAGTIPPDCNGHYSVTSFVARVSPGVKALTGHGHQRVDGSQGLALNTVQRFVKGEGYKTFYPCPCCGKQTLRAKDMMRVLDLNVGGDGQSWDEIDVHCPTKKKVVRKRKMSTLAEGGRKTTRQVKRKTKAREGQPKATPFDPFAPSSSRASM